MYFMISNTYFQSMLFKIESTQIDFLRKFIGWTLYDYDMLHVLRCVLDG